MEDVNPYRAPSSVESDAPSPATSQRRQLPWLLAGWTAVFPCNMVVPLLLGWDLTAKHGRGGMFAAAATLFLLGGGICVAWRKFGRALVFGGILIGLAQLFPVLQMMAGIVSLGIGDLLGQFESSDIKRSELSEFGGFVVTLITGTLLMAAALLAGLLLQAVLPRRWRKETSRQIS